MILFEIRTYFSSFCEWFSFIELSLITMLGRKLVRIGFILCVYVTRFRPLIRIRCLITQTCTYMLCIYRLSINRTVKYYYLTLVHMLITSKCKVFLLDSPTTARSFPNTTIVITSQNSVLRSYVVACAHFILYAGGIVYILRAVIWGARETICSTHTSLKFSSSPFPNCSYPPHNSSFYPHSSS